MYRTKRKAVEEEQRLAAANSTGFNCLELRTPRLRRRTAAVAAALAATSDGSDTGSRSAVDQQGRSQGLAGQEADQRVREKPQRPPHRKQHSRQHATAVGVQLLDTASHRGAPVQPQADPASSHLHCTLDAHRHQHLVLAELQLRTLADAGMAGDQLLMAAVLQSARRAQLATPHCANRCVMALLPRMRLHFSSDPAGLEHEVSCLLEAVTCGSFPLDQEADAPSPLQRSGSQRQLHQSSHEVLVRLTVFVAAGGVACWHQGPPEADLRLAYSPLAGSLTWSSPAFSLRFPGTACPQVDLFTAVHRYLTASRGAALPASILPPLLPSTCLGSGLGPLSPSAVAHPTAGLPGSTSQPFAPIEVEMQAGRAAGRAGPALPPTSLPLQQASLAPATCHPRMSPAAMAAALSGTPYLHTPSNACQQPQHPAVTSPPGSPTASELLFEGSCVAAWQAAAAAGVPPMHGTASTSTRAPLSPGLGVGNVPLDCPLLFDEQSIFDPLCFDSLFASL
ncbi:hypothetical protein D9Q98_007721 [Chlorella vulgaris]|uniref:Uncharacterized protein n=1 Tax=Chlorella vulgaris TaxID=3077 RepID=A0A9D4YTK9_CHLVU|nr:hypothetical protein D9Q98_007721 [Chlorella vulgaris]